MSFKGNGPAGLGGVVDTMHLPVDEADRARRAQAQATARGNLAAILFEEARLNLDGSDDPHDPAVRAAAAQIINLADILGLTQQPARAPGHCSCGDVLPMSSATSSPTCRPGFCAKCTAGITPTDRAPEAPAVPEPAPEPASGDCGWCERTYQLTHLGRLRRHNAWIVRSGVVTRIDRDCQGSWELPEDTRG